MREEQFGVEAKAFQTPEEQQAEQESDALLDKQAEKYRAKAREEGFWPTLLGNAASSMTYMATDIARVGAAGVQGMITGGTEGAKTAALEWAAEQRARELEHPIASKIGEYGVPIVTTLGTLGAAAFATLPSFLERQAIKQVGKEAARAMGKEVLRQAEARGERAVLGATLKEATILSEAAAQRAMAQEAERRVVQKLRNEAAKTAERKLVERAAKTGAEKLGKSVAFIQKNNVFGVAHRLSRAVSAPVEKKIADTFFREGMSKVEKSSARLLAENAIVKVPLRATTAATIDMPLFTLQHGLRESLLNMDPEAGAEYFTSHIGTEMLEGLKWGGYFGLAESALPILWSNAKNLSTTISENIPWFGRKSKLNLWTSEGAEMKTGVNKSTAEWMMENKEELDSVARSWPEKKHGRFFDLVRDMDPDDAAFFMKNSDHIINAADSFGEKLAPAFVGRLRELSEQQRVWAIENSSSLASLERSRPGLGSSVLATLDNTHGAFDADAANDLVRVAQNSIKSKGDIEAVSRSLYSKKKAQVLATREMLEMAYKRMSEDDSLILQSIGQPGGPASAQNIVDSSFDVADTLRALFGAARGHKLRHAKAVMSSLENAVEEYRSGLESIVGKDSRKIISPAESITSQLAPKGGREAFERWEREFNLSRIREAVEKGEPLAPDAPRALTRTELDLAEDNARKSGLLKPKTSKPQEISTSIPTDVYSREVYSRLPTASNQLGVSSEYLAEQATQSAIDRRRRLSVLRDINASEQMVTKKRLTELLKQNGLKGKEADQFVKDILIKRMQSNLEQGLRMPEALPTEQRIDQVLSSRMAPSPRIIRPEWSVPSLTPGDEGFLRTPAFFDPARAKEAKKQANSVYRALSKGYAAETPKLSFVELVEQHYADLDRAAASASKQIELTGDQVVRIARLQRDLRSAIGEIVSQGRLQEFGAKPQFQSRYMRANGVAKNAYGIVKQAVQSPKIWGQAGAARGEVDNVFSEFMREMGQSGSFRKHFMSGGTKLGKSDTVKQSVSLKKVSAFVDRFKKQLESQADAATDQAISEAEHLLGRSLTRSRESAAADSWHNMNKIMKDAIDVVERRIPDLVAPPPALKLSIKPQNARDISVLSREKELHSKKFFNSLREMNQRSMDEMIAAEKRFADTRVIDDIMQRAAQQSQAAESGVSSVGELGELGAELPPLKLGSVISPFGLGPLAKVGLALRISGKVSQQLKYRWQIDSQLRSMVEADMKSTDRFRAMQSASDRLMKSLESQNVPELLRIRKSYGSVATSEQDLELYRQQQESDKEAERYRQENSQETEALPPADESEEERLYREQQRIDEEAKQAEHAINILNRARSISEDPNILMKNMEDAGGRIAGLMPERFSHATQATARMAQEIAMIAPPRPLGLLDRETLTKDQISRINNVSLLASAPEILFDRVMDGSLTQNDVDVVSRIYPRIAQDIKVAVYSNLQQCAERGISVPYPTLCAANRLLGISTSASTSASVARSAQGVYSQGRPNGPGRPRETMTPAMVANRSSGRVYGASNLGVANRLLTDKQRSESRNA